MENWVLHLCNLRSYVSYVRDCEDSRGADGPGHKAETKVKGGRCYS